MRLFIGLPGPFGVIVGGGRRRAYTHTQVHGPGSKGLFWHPGTPPDSGFVFGSIYMAFLALSVAWNLLLIAVALVIGIVVSPYVLTRWVLRKFGVRAGTETRTTRRARLDARIPTRESDAARQDRLRREAAAYEIREAVRRQVQEAADRVSSRRPE